MDEAINSLSYTAVSYASKIWNMSYEETRALLHLAIKEERIFLDMKKDYFMLYVHGILSGNEATYKDLFEYLVHQLKLERADEILEAGGDDYEVATLAIIHHCYPLELPESLPPGWIDPLDNASIFYASVKWNMPEDKAREMLEKTAFEPLPKEHFIKHILSIQEQLEKKLVSLPTPPPLKVDKPIEPFIPKQTAWDKIVSGVGTILAIIILLLCAIAFVVYNSYWSYVPHPS